MKETSTVLPTKILQKPLVTFEAHAFINNRLVNSKQTF